MRDGISDMYVRTRGEYQSIDEIGKTIITMVDGKPIRINDIAEVVDGFQDVNRLGSGRWPANGPYGNSQTIRCQYG